MANPIITASALTTIYTHTQDEEILPASLSQAYVDGTMCCLPLGDGLYLFMAEVGGGQDRGYTGINYRWVGNDRNLPAGLPTSSGPPAGFSGTIRVTGAPANTFNYIGIGKILVNPNDGSLFASLHLERWPNGNFQLFYGSLGIARSTDNGLTWHWCGEIIQHNIPYTTVNPVQQDDGMGPLAIVGDYIYVWFREVLVQLDPQGDDIHGLGVARTLASTAFSDAINGTVSAWYKWDGTGWNEPGINGVGGIILNDDDYPSWVFDVYYDRGTQLFLIANAVAPSQIRWSSDGINWSKYSFILPADDANHENVYQSLWGSDPANSWSGTGPIMLTYVYNLSAREIHRRVLTVTVPAVSSSAFNAARMNVVPENGEAVKRSGISLGFNSNVFDVAVF